MSDYILEVKGLTKKFKNSIQKVVSFFCAL